MYNDDYESHTLSKKLGECTVELLFKILNLKRMIIKRDLLLFFLVGFEQFVKKFQRCGSIIII